MSFDAVLASHLNPQQRARLASACVGLAGAGGLGSNCAFFLARTGIGHLRIADPDTVALSNLNRQHYFPQHVGQPKVDALAEQLLTLRPDLHLERQQLALDAATAPAFFAGCTVVVEAVDDPVTKRTLVEALLAAGYTVVAASGMGGIGGAPMTARVLGRLTVVGDHSAAVGAGVPPLAPRVTMAAAMQADRVLQLLLETPA